MSADRAAVSERAAELARAFDRGFADPPPARDGAVDDLLRLRLGGTAYAIRVADIKGLVADRPVVPVPSAAPHLLGVAGLRGALVPVFSLDGLLGYPVPARAPRWLVLAGDPLLGLAFEHFDGHLRVARAEVSGRAGDAGDARAGDSVRDGNLRRQLIGIASLTAALSAAPANKEP